MERESAGDGIVSEIRRPLGLLIMETTVKKQGQQEVKGKYWRGVLGDGVDGVVQGMKRQLD